MDEDWQVYEYLAGLFFCTKHIAEHVFAGRMPQNCYGFSCGNPAIFTMFF